MFNQANHDVLAEAALWHVRLKAGSDADWDAFIRWLEGDPARAEAYDQIEAGHAAMTAEAFAVPAAAVVAANDDTPAPHWWRSRWAAGLAVAAGLALVLLASLPLLLGPRDLYEVTTAPGQHRQIALGDGSQALLNGATRLRLDRDDPRYTELLAGEATFVVRHDEADPFIVMAGEHRLQDAGTSFNVVHEGGDLSLEVIEGAVLFDPEVASVRVDAGRTLRLSGAGAPVVASADPRSMAGWRHGRLNYAGAPLRRVAGDMSRTLGVAVAVDPGLGQLPFTGSIRIQRDAGATVGDLAASLGLAARRDGAGWIIEPGARATR
jgi:transmembrane sensor